ncbi:hypothetical protein AXF42_Ash015951 [Apostasia shenzhenica]|uniref:Cystatin domain-containing protein n=1 Tax=Apostasia shenzhenica TaxID=1088818 RepID=A0A2I0AWG0_9ASPA|nr:hypothetical protein AXF42_Ash015951 [Apostasia shenzhenica]
MAYSSFPPLLFPAVILLILCSSTATTSAQPAIRRRLSTRDLFIAAEAAVKTYNKDHDQKSRIRLLWPLIGFCVEIRDIGLDLYELTVVIYTDYRLRIPETFKTTMSFVVPIDAVPAARNVVEAVNVERLIPYPPPKP